MKKVTQKTSRFKIFRWLDQTPNDIALNKRFLAYLIDWTLGGVFSGFPAVLMYGIITGKSDMFSNLYVFEAMGYPMMYGIIAGLLCILFALFYYVYVPWKIYPGQTLGKKICGVKIVKLDGSQVGLKTLLLRQAFAIFLLEGSVLIISNYIRQLVTIITRFYVDGVWQWIAVIITVASVALVVYCKSHRALHDYVGGTTVVNVTNQVIVKKKESAPVIKKVKAAPQNITTPNKVKRLPKKHNK